MKNSPSQRGSDLDPAHSEGDENIGFLVSPNVTPNLDRESSSSSKHSEDRAAASSARTQGTLLCFHIRFGTIVSALLVLIFFSLIILTYSYIPTMQVLL